jgi:hypothetical protein
MTISPAQCAPRLRTPRRLRPLRRSPLSSISRPACRRRARPYLVALNAALKKAEFLDGNGGEAVQR